MSATLPNPVPTAEPERLSRDKFVLIALLLGSAFVVILNETTMSVALAPLMKDLGITATTGQWLTTAFMLTMAVVIPATGYLLQRLGTRGAYLLAMSLFSAGTLLAAVSPTFPILLGARVVQASGTAIMMPLLMTTIMTIVPTSSRGKIMGNVAIVMAAAPALGPAISGVILNSLGWRWVFGIVLPIALVSLVAGFLHVRDTGERTRAPLDPLSLVLAVVAFGGLVYGLSSLGEAARHAPPVPPWIPLTAGSVMLVAFVARQLLLQRTDRALLDLRVFSSRSFAVSLGIMAVSMIALFGSLILLPLYLQDSLNLTSLTTGLIVLPGGLAMGLLGPTVGRLFDRVGPRPLVIPGAAVVLGALGLLTTVSAGTSPWFVLGAHVLLSLGLAFVFTPLFTTALGALEPHLYSHGSAVIGTTQQLAGAAGTAMFVAVMTQGSVAAGEAGASPAAALADGVGTAFVWGAAFMALAFALTFLLRRQPAAELEHAVAH
ncbi:drug resistance transporter, EmrB/QacA subfamily [Beutenbergia cavernae DSM 12333]|uniref:Drug resistance transporter, EmrB/QacA subfamily n=1 Tax=Beutenbergia cavernae (strain ATCC BAA-8 / DSM 12333 / CCUG 43141 / JCM 11478 / NBRC 16432 / NCIMB 13614 / HKI 0122) TaxID=471853 RepID=C5BZD4_BEUC1|nr:MDR family MFS transporter [Beutenbergia cavernae]ACQ79106.1 drug resistance transporter, EmrB/QacA subfamily [Beutenbergia cavernae DSM 12333]